MIFKLLISIIIGEIFVGNVHSTASFTIDYQRNQFLLDERPFRYISGSLDYFRIPPQLWMNRLQRVSALGFNAIQFYIPWNFHENVEGSFEFEGDRDFVRFIRMANNVGLYTLLRIGPYICGEWENGGLPWWLLKRSGIQQRTSDPKFLSAVENWFAILMPKIRPLLRENRGPVLMIQIENEYGSFPNADPSYGIWLRDLVRKSLGSKVVLYTTDGSTDGYMRNGVIPGVYATVDFGTGRDVRAAFEVQRKYTNHTGPFVNSEYYPGWLNVWGEESNSRIPSTQAIIYGAQAMYDLGASFNFYMIQGGTNFGFWNGAEVDAPVVTSYDYSAPISESGDITEKYLAIHSWMSSLKDWPKKPGKIPKNNTKEAYGVMKLQRISTIQASLLGQCYPIQQKPLLFEEIDQDYGFLMYSVPISVKEKKLHLAPRSFKDYAYVFIDNEYQGMLSHFEKNISFLEISVTKPSMLNIVVENAGRLTYETINDYKGILGQVYVENDQGFMLELTEWKTCKVDLDNLPIKVSQQTTLDKYGLFMGEMVVNKVADTFLDFSNWGKGILFVNGHNLGRYWSIGPQYALYVPSTFLQKGKNVIHVLELTDGGDDVSIDGTRLLASIDHPIWHWNSPNFSNHIQIPKFNQTIENSSKRIPKHLSFFWPVITVGALLYRQI